MCAISMEIGLSDLGMLSVPALAGVHAAIVCPLDDDGIIHAEDLARHANCVAQCGGIRGLLVNGHAGEGHLLSHEEKGEILGIVRDTVAPEMFLTAGITSEGTDAACLEAKIAAETGANALLVFPPNHWTRGIDNTSVIVHHRGIAEASGLPILLYKAPLGWGNMSYPPGLMERLINLEAVAGIKEGSWDVAAYEETWRLVKARRPGVSVMASGDEHLWACYQVGTDGSQVSLAALTPRLVVDLLAAIYDEDGTAARALHDRIYPLAVALYRRAPGYLATARLKAALKLLGQIDSDRVRHPMRQLATSEMDDLARVLERI